MTITAMTYNPDAHIDTTHITDMRPMPHIPYMLDNPYMNFIYTAMIIYILITAYIIIDTMILDTPPDL